MTESSQVSGEATKPSLNGWLRFDPNTRRRYEVEHGAERIAALRAAIYIGLFLYNAYNLTSIVLLHDILGLSVGLRVLLITPIALRSEEHTSELQSLIRISYAVFCLKKNNCSPNSMSTKPIATPL